MKYLRGFNENVSPHLYLEPGKLWNKISLSSFEKLEKSASSHGENITNVEDKILDGIINDNIVNLGFKIKSVQNSGFGYKGLYFMRWYKFYSNRFISHDIKFLKFEDELWSIDCVIGKDDRPIMEMATFFCICDGMDGVRDCVENIFA